MTLTAASHEPAARTGPEPSRAGLVAGVLARAGGSLLLEDLETVAADRAGLEPDVVRDVVSREPFVVELGVVRFPVWSRS